MKMMFGKWLGLALMATTAIALTGCAPKTEEIAVVNGETIQADDFNRYLQVKPEVLVVSANGEVVSARVADTLAFQALQDLVRQRIILQFAKDRGVMPSEKEITDEVTFQKSRDNSFVQNLIDRGLTIAQIKESLKVDLAREKLLTNGQKPVTPAEIDTYIKGNPAMFTEPATVDAYWIFVQAEAKKREVDRALLAGGSFENVAARFSDSPQPDNLGDRFPQRVLDRIQEPLRSLLAKAPLGNDTEWVRLTDGWAKFYVEKRTPAKAIEVNATERKWLERQLAVQRGLQASDLDEKLVERLQAAKITIKAKSLMDPWKNAMDRLEVQQNSNKKTGAASPSDEAK
jgi:parvulin-like peptidyl-prolyl isomerase